MPATEIAARVAVHALITHLKKWVANLFRASQARREESRLAIEKVILAVRKTAVYVRALESGQAPDYARESDIAVEWTALAMELERLGLHKLAKKCRVTGWYWEDQGRFDQAFLDRAQVSFGELEMAANRLLRNIDG